MEEIHRYDTDGVRKKLTKRVKISYIIESIK
jgi:hypothetical protein